MPGTDGEHPHESTHDVSSREDPEEDPLATRDYCISILYATPEAMKRREPMKISSLCWRQLLRPSAAAQFRHRWDLPFLGGKSIVYKTGTHTVDRDDGVADPIDGRKPPLAPPPPATVNHYDRETEVALASIPRSLVALTYRNTQEIIQAPMTNLFSAMRESMSTGAPVRTLGMLWDFTLQGKQIDTMRFLWSRYKERWTRSGPGSNNGSSSAT